MSLGSSSELFFAGSAAGGSYKIERSLRFNSADSAYLSRTPSVEGNRKTWTWAGWVKATTFNAPNVLFSANTSSLTTGYVAIYFTTDSALIVQIRESGVNKLNITSSVYRDPSAWYHLAVVVDTTQATAADRCKIYLNGSQVTIFSTQDAITQNFDTSVNDTVSTDIGVARNSGGTRVAFFNGYLADIHFIDGQALDPSSFGEFDTNGVWQPKAFGGSYGTNGFHLPFSDNSTAAALGTDTSGNGNTWTVNNISVAAGAGNDSLVDTPTSYGTDTGAGGEVRGNYATLNPLNKGSIVTISNGNLDFNYSAAGGVVTSTFPIPPGKWYWELSNAVDYVLVGCYQSGGLGLTYLGNGGVSFGFSNGGYTESSGVPDPTGSIIFSDTDVVGFAFDKDAGTLNVYKNNTLALSYTGLSGEWYPAVGQNAAGSGSFNFGQRPFAYTAPSGFKALCTTNLAEPTIADGSAAMDVALYTGNGTTQTISGLNFSPDLVWIKKRSGSEWHCINDTVRGAELYLSSNTTNAESGAGNVLTAFTSTGYTVGSQGLVNDNGFTFASWCWDAGSSTVTNTDGSITSQVRANASAGFSVVTYTGNNTAGATIGHGLGVAPQMLIIKRRDTTGTWRVGHSSLPSWAYRLNLDETDLAQINTGTFNSTAPTSTVFTVGSGDTSTNASGGTYVAYCFAPVAGYSSFGSYTGNGSADGPFVYTGFRPAFVIVKNSTTGEAGYSWYMWDSKRPGYNWQGGELFADQSSSENTGFERLDMLSNGFKLRTAGAAINGSGSTMIYAAFAESPFAYSRAR